MLTNAAGGVNTDFSQGALMLIDDHVNLMGANPLVGDNDDRFGPRFPDMTEVYSSRLRAIADRVGKGIGLALRAWIYVGLLGPSYETPAEIRYLRTIGADAVGMSTVPEAIAARHMEHGSPRHLVHHEHGGRCLACSRSITPRCWRPRTASAGSSSHYWRVSLDRF